MIKTKARTKVYDNIGLVTALLFSYSQLDGTCSADTVPSGCQGDEREDELEKQVLQTRNKESTEEEGQEDKSGACNKEEPIKQQPTDSKKAKSTPSAGAMPMTKKKKGAEKITFPTTLEGFGYEFISKYMDTCNTYCRVCMV